MAASSALVAASGSFTHKRVNRRVGDEQQLASNNNHPRYIIIIFKVGG